MAEFVYEWQRVAARIEAQIADGTLPAGAMLRGERALAEEHGVALGTVRRAVRHLRDRGLLVTLPHKGTYVAGRALPARRMTTEDGPPRPLPGGIGYVYAQLADDLAARIRAGEFPPGSRLPGRGRLAAEYGVAEMTVRRALAELEARRMVRRDAALGALVLHRRST